MRRIVCAAIRRFDGKIICGPRHYDKIMRGQIASFSTSEMQWRDAEQGFVDQYGRFLTREDALPVAQAANQIINHADTERGLLYSENLY